VANNWQSANTAALVTEHQLAQVGNLPIASDEGRGVGGQIVVAGQRWDQASHRIPSAKVPPVLACAKQVGLDPTFL
jgi:hypothetical protein